jgi:MoaA/NifB/PqqE/SkfB family radical SAM enzyme
MACMSPWLPESKLAGRLFVKSGPPVNLIFFVTSRCNLLCRHCFFWEELNGPRNEELSLDDIARVSQSLPNLLSLSLTGGEPYLRADLPDIAALFERHSAVRNIQIPSNGFLPDRIVTSTEELLGKVTRARVCTGVSLDGPPEIHNGLRGNDKSYQRALETFQGLKELKKHFPNLSVGLAVTFSAANQSQVTEFFRAITQELTPDAVTVTLVRGEPVGEELTTVDLDLYERFTTEVIAHRRERPLTDGWTDRLVIAKEEATYGLVREAAGAGRRIAPCYAGELLAVLRETGEVYPCETLDKPMGNVREFGGDLADLWISPAAREVRRYQRNLGCQCTYECAMGLTALFTPSRALRLFGRSLR